MENINNQLPYNPSDVDIRQQTFSVYQLVQMISSNEIELGNELDYDSWTYLKKSRLIESLLMRIPLPIFYFDGSEKPWKIIDGLHRLTTFFSFIGREESFPLEKLEYLKDLEGLTFQNLPFKYRMVIEESIIQAYVINPGTPEKIKLNIFQRINTGGHSLNRQEIRSVYYSGVPTDFINKLAKSPKFLQATNNKVSSNRMKDKEVVLRFFSFYKYLDKYTPTMDEFLDYTIESINKLSHQDLADIKERFNSALDACTQIFGENAFYILRPNGEKLNSEFNIALFETWVVNLAQIKTKDIRILIENKEKIINTFVILLQDYHFQKSISSDNYSDSYSENYNKNNVEIRFSTIKELLNNIINAH